MTAPRPGRRRLAGLVLAAATAATALLVTHSADAGTPPWQQGGGAGADPNRVGTLSFYDGTGAQVFSGSTTSAPFAAYVVGSDTLRAGDTKASLFAYLPDAGKPAAAWTGSLLTSATAYPNAGAPGLPGTATTPVFTGSAADTLLDDFVAGHQNPSSAADYQGIYELRLRTSAPGSTATATYDVADLKITGSTWQVVYPAHFTDTTTTLTAVPASGLRAGQSVTLHASISDPAVTGTVRFSDGSTVLGTDVAVSGGIAEKTVTVSTAGNHTFHAAYQPAADSTFAGSTGDLGVAVGKATSTTTGTWPTTAPRYGTKFTVGAIVKAGGLVPTGTVSLRYGTRTLASATLSAGRATLTVPGTALTPGSRALTLVYGGSANVAGSTTSRTLTIAKAIAKVTSTLSTTRISRTRHARIAVKVTAAGVVPTGSVAVYDGTRRIATGTLSRGAVTITLPLLTALGKHAIHATYLGSSLVAAARGATLTLTVTR